MLRAMSFLALVDQFVTVSVSILTQIWFNILGRAASSNSLVLSGLSSVKAESFGLFRLAGAMPRATALFEGDVA